MRTSTAPGSRRKTRWLQVDEFRIRCVGAKLLTTVWVNDLLVAEIDLALGQDRWAPSARCRWRNMRIKEL
jgi:hypothetical protein